MRELHAGDSATLPLAPLRVALTGVQAGAGVSLRVTESGVPAQVFWQSPIEAIVPPIPRNLSLVVEGADGGLIPPGSRVGLSIAVEGGSGMDQITVSPEDVGAKSSVTFAAIEILASGATITIGEVAGTPGAPNAQDLGWVGPGAYAFREAFANAVPDSALPWTFVVDGSVSMVRSLAADSVAERVMTTAGIVQEWMRRPPKAAFHSGPREPVQVQVGPEYASDLIATVRANPAPPSWLHLAPIIESAARVLTSGGVVVSVLDGIAADMDRTLAALDRNPQIDLRIVVSGTSALGLPSEPRPDWYADDLAVMSELADRAVIVAVAPSNLAPSAVEIARLLAGPDSKRSLV